MSNFLKPARAFTPAAFAEYVAHVPLDGAFKPSMVVLHNTGNPSLAMRPKGFSDTSMVGLRTYYENLGWNGGPHLFIDQTVIWLFNGLDVRGTHSPSWNGKAWGVEMLGDFSKEPFDSGPGAQVRDNAVIALAAMFVRLKRYPDDVSFKLHYEDPLTDHACPGKNVSKDAVRNLVVEQMKRAPVYLDGVPVKIVVYRKGKGQFPTAVVDGALKNGVTVADAAELGAACFDWKGVKSEIKPVRGMVEKYFDLKWVPETSRVYLFEKP